MQLDLIVRDPSNLTGIPSLHFQDDESKIIGQDREIGTAITDHRLVPGGVVVEERIPSNPCTRFSPTVALDGQVSGIRIAMVTRRLSSIQSLEVRPETRNLSEMATIAWCVDRSRLS